MGMSTTKATWNLSLLYKNENDPQIEKDVILYAKACDFFAKKYRSNEAYLSDPKKLLQALTEYESIIGMHEGWRAFMYFRFRLDLNGQDRIAENALNKYTEQATASENKIVFFRLDLGKLDKATQNTFFYCKCCSQNIIFLRQKKRY